MTTPLCDKRLFLLDMDGTIYLDDTLFDGTLDFLRCVRERGGRYLFVTNNSSKGVEAYVEKLRRIGIDAKAEDFLTSTDATVWYIQKNCPTLLFYVMGTPSFVEQLKTSGVRVTESVCDGIGGVILSNDTTLTFQKLSDVSRLLTESDLVYLATNPDWVCPTSFGYVPDCGSFADMLFRATGKKPFFIGKPRPDMLTLSMDKLGYHPEDCLMVGDRLYTDIASGVNAGIDTVFVLSGEGTMQTLADSDVKPTYVMKDIRELCHKMQTKKMNIL